jgi:hypothetical protein
VFPFLRGLPCKPRINMIVFRLRFDVTFRAGGRASFFPSPLLFFVALDAQLVHDLLLGEIPLGLELLDGPGFLGKSRMANGAVRQLLLMALVREGDLAARAAFQDDFRRPRFLRLGKGCDPPSSRHQKKDHDHPYPSAIHSIYSPGPFGG